METTIRTVWIGNLGEDVMNYLHEHANKDIVYEPKKLIAQSLPTPVSRASLYKVLYMLQEQGKILVKNKVITILSAPANEDDRTQNTD